MTTAMAATEQRRTHCHESWQRARGQWRGRSRAYSGHVRLELSTHEMEIDVPIRIRHKPEDLALALLGRKDNRDAVQTGWLEAEVLENRGQFGFLVRLVRRVIDKSESGLRDQAEFVFRVPKAPMSVTHCGDDVSGEDGVRTSPLGWPLTPVRFCRLATTVRSCTVVLTGNFLFIRAIWHQGRVYHVGSHCPQTASPERRVIDVN